MFIVRSSFAYPSLILRLSFAQSLLREACSYIVCISFYRVNGEEHFLFLVTFIKKGLCDTLFFSIFAK